MDRLRARVDAACAAPTMYIDRSIMNKEANGLERVAGCPQLNTIK